MTKRKLTRADKKEIKTAIRMGYILPAIVLVLAALVNLYYFLAARAYLELYVMLLINLAVVFLFVLIAFLLNRKHYKDLNEGFKRIERLPVADKEDKTSYEAGSGELYTPVLGKLFPKLWGREAKMNYLMFLVIDRYRYEVRKEVFDVVKKGDYVEMHYSIHGNLLLGIEKAES